MKSKTTKAPGEKQDIAIPEIKIETFVLTLIGDSPLICHKWSTKALREIEAKQAKKAQTGRAKRDPKAEFLACLYEHPDGGYGFPAISFKHAAIRAAKLVGLVMADVLCMFHVDNGLVKIEGSKPRMRTDMVRVGQGSADVRYRPEFEKWSVQLRVRYNANAISAEQLVNLFNVAGFGVGVGDWRPEKKGTSGTWHIKQG